PSPFTLSLHDALPIWSRRSNCSEENFHPVAEWQPAKSMRAMVYSSVLWQEALLRFARGHGSRRDDSPPNRCRPWFHPREYSSTQDRKSTRLNSSHVSI